jgi:hypothetical protein
MMVLGRLHSYRFASEKRLRHSVCGLAVAVLWMLPGAENASAQSAVASRCGIEQRVARIVAVEGEVLVLPPVGTTPVVRFPANPGPTRVSIAAVPDAYDICPRERIRSGPRSRASVQLLEANPGALTLLESSQIITIDQNTEIQILKDTAQEPSVIDLVAGFMRLFNPIGRPLSWRTTVVSGGTDGTEFFVGLQDGKATVGLIEGLIHVDTALQRATGNAPAPCTEARTDMQICPGEVFDFARGMRPVRRQLGIPPTDNAVRWAIYYPAAIWELPPEEEASLNAGVSAAWRAWREGRLSDLAAVLGEIDPATQSPRIAVERLDDERSLLRFAALTLTIGRVDEAEEAITRAEGINPRSPLIAALRSVIAVSQNRINDALTLSKAAIDATRAGNDPVARIGAAVARSYALQANFDLTGAKDILTSDPIFENDPLVSARLAELDFSLGNNAAARAEAQRAIDAAPSLGRPRTLLGFALLANFQSSAARGAFVEAANRDPADPLAHLGLGLTAIRSGGYFRSQWRRNLEIGRSELTLAVALDPEDSLARSYLGKAYASADLHQQPVRDQAFREWALAEEADPRDPTAPLYRAFAERALNRPVEALRDIQTSIARNGNRAVYRSRLQVDSDLATRTTDQASIYRDLGFDQLALSEGYKSVDLDPANPGAHRFLSDSYLSLPRHETASDSELLQSLLLQPINVQPLRPRLAREGLGILDLQGPFRIGFSEFSPVFATDGLSVLADAFGGTRGTYGDNLVMSGIRQNVSASIGQFFYMTDGIRPNDQLRRDIESGFVQLALSDRVSVLAEYRHSALTAGDTGLFFDPASFTLTGRQTSEASQYRLGGRFDAAPGVTIVGVWTRQHLNGGVDPGFGTVYGAVTNGDFGETAVYLSRQRYNVVAGGGYFEGKDIFVITDNGTPIPFGDNVTTHGNAWVYANGDLTENFHLTLGASYDHYRSTLINRDQIKPKLGFRWDLIPGSVFRAAYFETLKRTTVGGQTIEPTQIAGFNQLFDDSDSTNSKRWGVGFDQKVGNGLFAGIEWSQRQLSVPVTSTTPPFGTIEQPWKEDLAHPYFDWILSDRFSVNAGLQWQRFVRDAEGFNDQNFRDLDLITIPLEFRYSDPSGMFALLRASLVRESGHFLETNAFTIFGGRETFGVVDAGIGWRIPGRAVVGSLQIKNLLNSGFRFQDTDPTNPTIIPHRLLLGRVTVSF